LTRIANGGDAAATMDSGAFEFSLGDRLRYGAAFMLEHLTGYEDPKPVVRTIKTQGAQRVLARVGADAPEADPTRLPAVAEVGADIPVEEFRREYMWKCRPVIIRGLARDWPCVQKWTPQYFYDKFASSEIALHDNEGLVSPDAEQRFESETLGSYLQRLEKGRAGKYLKFSQFLYQHPELLDDLNLDQLHRMQGNLTTHADYQIFIGGEGCYTPMHCGLPGNLFIQVYGKKTWLLYPARAYPAVDPPAARLFYFYSHVDPYHLDREAYPLFPLVDGYTVSLDAGDLFWNPPFWWHCVTNDTDSIAIAYRFNSLRLALRCSRLLTVASFMATKPTIVHHALKLFFKGEKTHLTEKYSRRARAA
jgi:lysine-specific demethylase 8